MKIALLTNLIEDYTGHINIGDVFIRFGLQYILEKAALPETIEWVLISRFSKLSQESLDKMKTCDLIVYGGMPQYNNLDDWKFYYDDEIWDDLNSLNKPILRLAGGGGYPSETWTPEEFAEHLCKSDFTKKVLHKSLWNTECITTRDKMAQAFLESVDVKSTLLPCSGTFAALYNNPYGTNYKSCHAICLTAAYLKDRPDRKELMDEFKKTKVFLESLGKKCLIIAQVKRNDVPFLLEEFEEEDVIFTDNALEIINYYHSIDICVSTRLHCALPIYGIGGRVILIRVDTRGIAGEECGIPVIPLSDYTHDKFMDIYENDKFSKIPVEELVDKCVDNYSNMFKMLDVK